MTDIDRVRRELIPAIKRGERVLCIHYACGNFFETTDKPVPITCIALSEPTDSSSAQNERSYSISNAPDNPDVEDRERDLLKRFYADIQSTQGARFVHWNMNRAIYGFNAIADRYRYLFEEDPPVKFVDDRLYDLDSIIGNMFGDDFAKHPKLRNISALNGLYMPFFKDGKEEAEAAKIGDFGLIASSTSEKAHLICLLLMRLANGTLRTQNSVGMLQFGGAQLDAVSVVLAIADRFIYVKRSLKKRHGGRPPFLVDDEYDAQDLLRSLLVQFFDDVRPEEWSPSYAGASSRIDFIIPEFELAIELKYTRESLTARKVGEELLVDRNKYAEHKAVKHLICIVFDYDGHLANPRGLESDLDQEHSNEHIAVTVKIVDR